MPSESAASSLWPPDTNPTQRNERAGRRIVVLKADVAPSRRVLGVTAGLVVVSMALFVLIAEDLIDGGGLISHDEAALTWFVDHRADWMISAARFVSTIGAFASLLCAGVVLGVWLWWRRGWRLWIAVAPAASLLLAGLAATISKAVFDRARPPIVVHETHVSSPAFPSGHATDAAGFFLAAALILAITVAEHRRTQLLWIGTGVLLTALVGLSRLVLGVHWLSDVVAGWALGTAIAVSLVVAMWCVQPARTDRPAHA
jgi:undecaprenyl-diphosphatase